MTQSTDASDKTLVAYVDGGARGNPGPAGAGVHFEIDGAPWRGFYEFLGRQTNNYAEYSALLKALELGYRKGFRRVRVFSDSLLLVQQLRGVYRVKNPSLRLLHAQATQLIRGFEDFHIEHVPRGENQQADMLANIAMDRQASGEEPYPT